MGTLTAVSSHLDHFSTPQPHHLTILTLLSRLEADTPFLA